MSPFTKDYVDPLAFLRDVVASNDPEAAGLDLTGASSEPGECYGEFVVTGPSMPLVRVFLGVRDEDGPSYNEFLLE